MSADELRRIAEEARRRPDEAHRELERLFLRGAPPDPPLHGEARGILLTPVLPAPAEAGLRAFLSAWMPWQGKRFDAGAASGDNLLAPGFRLPAKLLWPSLRLEPAGPGRLAGFPFRTSAGPGELDPDREVLKLDYDVAGNPRLLVRSVLDELVQVAPGVHLGKMLVRPPGRRTPRVTGYFALES